MLHYKPYIYTEHAEYRSMDDYPVLSNTKRRQSYAREELFQTASES